MLNPESVAKFRQKDNFFDAVINEAEKELLTYALIKSGGNIAQAGRILKISSRRSEILVKKHNIDTSEMKPEISDYKLIIDRRMNKISDDELKNLYSEIKPKRLAGIKAEEIANSLGMSRSELYIRINILKLKGFEI